MEFWLWVLKGTSMGLSYKIEKQLTITPRARLMLVTEEPSGAQFVFKRTVETYPSPIEIAHIRQEYNLLATVSSEAVVKAHGLERIEDGYGFLMEYFAGKTLAQSLPDIGAQSLEQRLKIVEKIALALQTIHDHGIIHGDFNPRNIMIDPAGDTVKVIDFSLAMRMHADNQEQVRNKGFAGSLPYMAPEQTGRMNRDVDSRADLYSLGVTIFEILTGALPFSAPDIIGYMHAHIAKRPPKPSDLKAELPPQLDAIIMKLLEKNPENRYQTAGGLAHDLAYCGDCIRHDGTVSSFELGTADKTEQLEIPTRLYGREAELQLLLDCFEQSIARFTFMTVSGHSGIGKTRLIREIDKPILARRGFFISGKFDQFGRNNSLSAICYALKQLVTQIVLRPDEELKTLQNSIRHQLGDARSLILELVPELSSILAPENQKQQPLSASEQSRRQLRGMIALIRAVTEIVPLTLFIDDLQWADQGTLELMRELSLQQDLRGLFIIGAYRDNAVDVSHPLQLMLDEFSRKQQIHTIRLAPLSEQATREFLQDTLKRSDAKVAPLCQWITEQSEGNPFFTIEILRDIWQQKVLFFDREEQCWSYKEEALKVATASEDVTEFLSHKLLKMAEADRHTLQVASCIGHRFSLGLLARFLEITTKALIQRLKPATQQHLIVCQSHDFDVLTQADDDELIASATCLFRHDRIQQAAYQMNDKKKLQEIYLKLARIKAESAKTRQDRMEIAEYYFIAADLVKDPQEVKVMLHAWLQGAAIAKASNAYKSAVRLAAKARDHLPQQSWQNDQQLVIDIHMTLFECNFLNADFAENEAIVSSILPLVKGSDKELELLHLLCKQYVVQGRSDECFAVGKKILGICGINIPQRPNTLQVASICITIKRLLARKGFDALIDALEIHDSKQLLVLKVLFDLLAAATNTGNKKMIGYSLAKATELAIHFGNSSESAYAYVSFSTIATFFLNDPKLGRDFAVTGMKIIDKLMFAQPKGRTFGCYANFAHNWHFPGEEYADILKKALEYAYEEGDLLWIAATAVSIAPAMRGIDLNEFYSIMKKYMNLVEATGQRDFIAFGKSVLGYVNCLRGVTDGPLSFSYSGFDDTSFIAEMEAAQSAFSVVFLHINKAECALCLDQPYAAQAYLQRVVPHKDALTALVGTLEYHLLRSLAAMRLHREGSPLTRAMTALSLLTSRMLLKKWSRYNPGNFLFYHLFFEAEWALFHGDQLKAQKLYLETLTESRKLKLPRHETLALHHVVLAYQHLGLPAIAVSFAKELAQALKMWGAISRFEYIQSKFPEIPRDEALPQPSLTGSTWHLKAANDAIGSASINATISGSLHRFDNEALMKASQAMIAEVKFDKLLQQLSDTLLEYAGATKVVLALTDKESETLQLVMARNVEDKEIQMYEKRLDDTHASSAILRRVARTGQIYVLDDVGHAAELEDDPYIKAQRPASILCIPIIHQTTIRAILYLENGMARAAFPSQHIKVLTLISAQVAVAIENALLYRDLEQRVNERTRKISSIMKSIQQGIFSISKGDLILDEEYAPYLEQIFGVKNLAGRALMPLLFPPECGLGADQIERIKAALEASIGDDSFAFAVNSAHLPREVILTRPHMTQILEVDWSPIHDLKGITERVLVSVRDVTSIRQWQQEIKAGQIELTMIGELIEQPHRKCHEFFQEVEQCLSLFNLKEGQDKALLLRRLHTLKGTARYLKFARVADLLHHIESSVLAVNDENLSSRIGELRAMLRDYQRLLVTLQRRDDANDEALFDLHVKKLAETILGQLSRTTDKPLPRLFLDIPAVKLADSSQKLMEQVLLHLLRNAMDHGIEPAEMRTACGKEAHGSIEIRVKMVSGQFMLLVSDDGRGLNLAEVRRKALHMGLIAESEEDLAKIADTIFVSGLTTAEKVSDISGRGVGLDVVRSFLRDQGGDIAIEFTAPPTLGPTPFRFVIQLPLAQVCPPALAA
jgi:predicted ATPase/signal transduction histidine kinase